MTLPPIYFQLPHIFIEKESIMNFKGMGTSTDFILR